MCAFVGLARERFSFRTAAELVVILGVIAAIRLGYVFADARGFGRDVISLGVVLLATVIVAVIIALESVGIAHYALFGLGAISSVFFARAVFGNDRTEP